MKSKLVRDNIPQIITKSGKKAIIILADKKDIIDLLKDKLIEEAHEAKLSNNKAELVEELADVLQVVKSLCQELKFNFKSLEVKTTKKAKTKGEYQKGYILKNILK